MNVLLFLLFRLAVSAMPKIGAKSHRLIFITISCFSTKADQNIRLVSEFV